eukprot:CAMPEP_0202464656 /NCGR_PEP_ID=MMETSP1360-20130828/62632_1 /ASSEMBLY_ACC=CAM_ASM_000848 /TAXON_ID=515479 /ORGANISM="Licmophora paradoxa, Strain CCMP2313" /LENGTH=154 /DNA_ID=CAMNT_0049088055 /DNA_START=132 /DNA_END=592 /DNA_ORIENTATION=-
MSTIQRILLLCAMALVLTQSFVIPPSSTTARFGSSSSSTSPMATQLNVFSPKEALSIERLKNPKKTEATIAGLMKSKKLTRAQAEKRYGEFLLDPDGFALRAADAQMREKGYKDWKERAIGESDDPEATRKRIDEFQAKNSIKGTAIILVFFSA